MNRSFSFGLAARVVIALSVVFALLILLNEFTVTSVLQLSLSKAAAPELADGSTHVSAARFIAKIRKPILLYSLTAALVSLFIASIAIHRIVIKPVRRIASALDEVTHGNVNVRVDVEGAGELMELSSNFNRMIDTISRQQHALQDQLEQLKLTSDHLRKSQNDLIRAAQLASVGTLASGVAHEIGNPLAGILGLLEALENESSEETARSYRKLISKEIGRIDKTIRDLLSYARPTGSDQPAEADFSAVLDHVKGLVQVQKSFGRISLDIPVDCTYPLLAIARDDLTSILINLLLNAATAINGQGTIRIFCEVETRNDNRLLAIHVVDDGPGIDDAIVHRIFDPFFTNRTAGGGTGLGLAICTSICQRNNVTLELYHPRDPGAHFRIVIPFASPSSTPGLDML